MTITFQNPGLIDHRAMIVLGVNAKVNGSPIGYFGTGLKYAIATLLRNDLSIEIWRGKTKVTFSVVPDFVRGQEFGFIKMFTDGPEEREEMTLGFTTDLGKNWSLFSVYRELYSNCIDESGEVFPSGVAPKDGFTTIKVHGRDFEKVHLARAEFILARKGEVIWKDEVAEVWPGRSSSIFYRGIAVHKLDKPSYHTYNMLYPVELTEDRTAASTYDITGALQRAFLKLPTAAIKPVLLDRNCKEWNIDYNYSSPSPSFFAAMEEVYGTHPLEIPESLIAEYYRSKPEAKPAIKSWLPSKKQLEMLNEAQDILHTGGLRNEYEVEFSMLGEHVIAAAVHGKILLSKAAFAGEDILLQAMVEEYMHLRSGASDMSRRFQSHLIVEIMTLLKKISE